MGVLDGFFGLWYDIVVGCYYQYYDVGQFGIVGMYGCKCCVVWGIQEVDYVFWCFNVVSIDVLGDVIGFVCGDFGVVDVIQQ